jgi:hypothetical protein
MVRRISRAPRLKENAITTAKPDSPESGFLFSRFSPSATPPSRHDSRLKPPRPMPAIATAPDLAAPRLAPATAPFLGRSLAEYEQFFALDVPALRGRDVLDVAAGPSSFTAEACARKIDAVAVDPRYGCGSAALAHQVRSEYEQHLAQIRIRPRAFGLKSQAALAAAELDWRYAAQRFLADYETHFIGNRYVCGSLPRLPFFDGTFDLVLCSHLLFLPGNGFDEDWHLAACRELVRVTVDEVRLYPVVGEGGRPHPALARLRRELRGTGIASNVQAVKHEFMDGPGSMLVLRRAES